MRPRRKHPSDSLDTWRFIDELHIHPAAPSAPGHPEVTVIRADANSKFVNGESWHSDVSCDTEPPMGSVHYLRTMPEVGGDA